jgi:hypothetical protein
MMRGDVVGSRSPRNGHYPRCWCLIRSSYHRTGHIMTGAVLKAAEVAPAAFQQSEGGLGRPDDLVYDLRHLTAFDNHAVSTCFLCASPAQALPGAGASG